MTNFNQVLIDYLQKCGVCEICMLRYLKARGCEYVDRKETFRNLNIKLLETEDDLEEPQTKKQKLNTCPTCLGLFSEKMQEELIKAVADADIDKFDYNGIVIAITTPLILHIRQLAMWYALLKEFPDNIYKNRPPDVPIKEACKLILNPIICNKLNKTYDLNGVSININLNHSLEECAVNDFKQLHDHRMAKQTRKKGFIVSRTLLENQYNPLLVNLSEFETYFELPPPSTADMLTLESVKLIGPPVYIAGRYRKYSRDLSHTPWILNGIRMKEDSIEEILIRNIAPHFCEDTSKVVFMSSGREDVDVRCLGRGRPFLLEIPNSLHSNMTTQEAYKIEQEIDKSGKVSARNLQVVPKEEQTFIKTGEEHKKKHYRALCKLKEPVTLAMIEKLNSTPEFQIQQETPLRVLHRRPLLTRPRTIYEIKAFADRERNDVMIIEVKTQAGTYIKELVHGEFGRTHPSIASIIGAKIDIIALDVVDIDFDWPKNIDNQISTKEKEIESCKIVEKN